MSYSSQGFRKFVDCKQPSRGHGQHANLGGMLQQVHVLEANQCMASVNPTSDMFLSFSVKEITFLHRTKWWLRGRKNSASKFELYVPFQKNLVRHKQL